MKLYALTSFSFVCLASTSYANMTFEQCASLNKGVPASYVQTYIGGNKRTFKSYFDVAEKSLVVKEESTNTRRTTIIPYGLIMPQSTSSSKTEAANGEIETFESEADFGVDLATVLSTQGPTVYEKKFRYRENATEWKNGPARKVQITIKANPPVVIGGCSIDTKVLEVANAKKDGTFGDPQTRVIYAPSAMLTIKWAEEYKQELVMRELLDIEPKP